MALKILLAACTFLYCATIFTTEYNAEKSHELLQLCMSQQEPSTKTIKELLAAGANPNTMDNHGQTPLHWAIDHGHTSLVELLLVSGANVNALTHLKDTPLHFAATYNNELVAELLLQHGADIKTTNHFPSTTCSSFIKLLITYGAQEPLSELIVMQATHLFITLNPSSFASRKDKITVTKNWIAHAMLDAIKNYSHYAQFTQEELYTLMLHLGYISIRLDPKDITQIVWHLPLLHQQQLNAVLEKLPLRQQKILLKQALAINSLCSMQTRPFTDVIFI